MGEVLESLRAQVEGEEVAGRALAPIDRRVMHGGPVPVSVGGVEVKIPETLQMREGIVASSRATWLLACWQSARRRLLLSVSKNGRARDTATTARQFAEGKRGR